MSFGGISSFERNILHDFFGVQFARSWGEITKEDHMNLKTGIVVAILLAPGAALVQSSGSSNPNTIHPDPNASVGGSKSERTNDGNVLPKGSSQAGTVEKGTGSPSYSQPSSGDSKQTTVPTGRKSGDTTVGKDTDQPNQTPKH